MSAGIHRIGLRVLLHASLVAAAGLSAVIFLYAASQERAYREQSERALAKVADSVTEGLRAVMLKGHADIGHDFAARLRRLGGAIDYRVLRADGREAFLDNATIDRVNAHLGQARFGRRAGAAPAAPSPALVDQLRSLRDSGRRRLYYETLDDGRPALTVLEPIGIEEGCTDCHADGDRLRGVVKLTRSVGEVEQDIRASWFNAIGIALGGLLLIAGAVFVAAQKSVVRPIRTLTRAMEEAARGDLSVRVPVFGHDEIGDMAESFNRMSARLLDVYAGLQDEQAKLVSIILEAREGIVVADAAEQVVLVNPAATELLGKSEHQIVEDGLRRLLDGPGGMGDWLDAGGGGSVLPYRQRLLDIHVSTLAGAQGGRVGSAVVLRDVTEEERLEAELRRLAHTDALTGLGNRHRFDAVLGDEFGRARRYRTAFALLLIDIDRFKAFNDQHGHDFGDRVLRAVAATVERQVDGRGVCCRYGGEELVVVLPDADDVAALELAESLRRAVEALSVEGRQVTVSVGVAAMARGLAAPGDLIERADGALYEAKRRGRNRVEAAP